MEDITDSSFRLICKDMGVDLLFTEFISSEGLIRDAVKSKRKLDFSEKERPIGIQIFGHDIDSMKLAAITATQSKPDLIDINWGCPVRKVASKGAGAGMLKDINKMVKITSEVVQSIDLPVTVKTRLGWDENNKNIVEIAERLQDVGIKAISIHGRTKSQMYRGEADWTLIGKVKNNQRMKIPVFGNGDITEPQHAFEMKNKYNVDGIMIGRGSIGNPWIFKEIKHYFETGRFLAKPELLEKVKVCRNHLENSIEIKGERTAIFEIRKHYSSYFRAIPNFKQFRIKLMTLTDLEEIENLLTEIGNSCR
ncbi:MAG: tRNA dihydrouridine synthase DusB [Bacteroidales bacterium]|nr:tRNA dihydrouridine synthase DusB [Bacteroidales bacterium]